VSSDLGRYLRYELFLRCAGGPDDLDGLDDLDEDALPVIAEQASELQLTLDPYRDERDRLRGVDLGLPLDAPASHSRKLGELALALAKAHQLTIFDPQQSQTLTQADLDQLKSHFEASAGVVRMGFSPESAAPRSSSSKLWLALGALVLFVLVAGRALSCAMS
jgi:hypothetical protein